MKDTKETRGGKFIKRLSLFLAGILTALGISHAVNTLPEGRNQTEKAPTEATETLSDENSFKENLKYEIKEPVKTEREQLADELKEKLSKAKDKEELEEIMLKDIKQRYVKEYNEIYGTDYTYHDLSIYYSSQSYAYVKDGKFYGKEKVEGAELLNDKFAYRIYDSSDKQLEAVLEGNSSEDINLLGKYQSVFKALRSVNDFNSKEVVSDLYLKGVLKLHDAQQENLKNGEARG